jgi:hypothetical protein
MTDPRDHVADPSDHLGAIPVITFGRSRCSRWSETRNIDQNDGRDPHHAYVTWVEPNGQEVGAEFGESALREEIARAQAAGVNASVFKDALAELLGYPRRVP